MQDAVLLRLGWHVIKNLQKPGDCFAANFTEIFGGRYRAGAYRERIGREGSAPQLGIEKFFPRYQK